ncbi:MAG TPA: SoxXA-binding protein [Gammaproteobacteria bacterium]|jgi:hypothetical protein
MKKTLLTMLFSLMLGACATPTPEPTAAAPTADMASSAIAAARDARERAASVGFEWRDTGALIDDAAKAAEAREYARAIELANQAQRQSLAALEQYESQKAQNEASGSN